MIAKPALSGIEPQFAQRPPRFRERQPGSPHSSVYGGKFPCYSLFPSLPVWARVHLVPAARWFPASAETLRFFISLLFSLMAGKWVGLISGPGETDFRAVAMFAARPARRNICSRIAVWLRGWETSEANMHRCNRAEWRQIGLSAISFFAVSMALGYPAQGAEPPHSSACKGDNGGLTLSPGFCATVFADNLGHVRHMVVAADGTLYANTWSGRYFANSPPPPGGFLIALKDTTGAGHADIVKRFGVTVEEGGTGGSGIRLYNGGLYAEENSRILRYALAPGEMIRPANRASSFRD